MKLTYGTRRFLAVLILLLTIAVPVARSEMPSPQAPLASQDAATKDARASLEALAVKGRAPKTGYSRKQFGNGWSSTLGCDTRNRILARDLKNMTLDKECKVIKGRLDDPYTGKQIAFVRGETTSDDVQIDHVIALSNAWQTGAQQLTSVQRVTFANDPLNLLAVDGPANEEKSDGDAATWLPSNKLFRCQYIIRQIRVKTKYSLWITPPEKKAMSSILQSC